MISINRVSILTTVFLTVGVTFGSAQAQLSVTSLAEAQRGRVPNEDPEALTNVYEQFNVDYATATFQAGGRFEVYRASVDNRRMTFLSQRYVSWSNGPTYVIGGNFYGILGRGLTMRAFELPGVILESTTFRQRYTNTQDMEGGLASWTGERFEARALAGRPVAGDIPPGYPNTISVLDKLTGLGSDRRRDWMMGGEMSFRPIQALKLGGTVVNIRPERVENSYAWSWLGGLDLGPMFERAGLASVYGDLYAEIARREKHTTEGHGRYLAGTIGIGSFGLSVEYKDYDKFNLLANDPPQLVREHSAYLLNRNTHLLQTFNEKGFQVEAVYPIPGLGTVTGNVSRGKNQLSSRISTVFDERFVSVDLDFLPENHTTTVFFDWGKDELEALAAHRTGGILVGRTTGSGQSFDLDLELQRGKLPFGSVPWYWDTYAAVSWQSSFGFGAALAMDRSTNLAETDQSDTFEVETDPVIFFSVNLNARFGPYEALLFAGERRGGTACTSGTCYEVLAFRGAEMRFLTRF